MSQMSRAVPARTAAPRTCPRSGIEPDLADRAERASGASWSSMLNDCIATVSPMPEVMYDVRKRAWQALPRITLSLPQ